MASLTFVFAFPSMSDIASVEGSGSSRSSEESATSSVLTPTDESDEETGSTSGAAAKELSSPRVSAVDGAGQAGIASLVGSAEDDVAVDGSAQGADNEVAVKQRGERRHKKRGPHATVKTPQTMVPLTAPATPRNLVPSCRTRSIIDERNTEKNRTGRSDTDNVKTPQTMLPLTATATRRILAPS